MSELSQPVAFYAEQRFDLRLKGSLGASARHRAGGRTQVPLVGVPRGSRPLQRLLELGDELPFVDESSCGGRLELLYGFCYSGCRLTYSFTDQLIQMLELEPAAGESDWPYPGFPDVLPEVPLEVDQRLPWDSRRVAREFLDGAPLGGDQALIVVPALRLAGVPLWDPEGEAEGVEVLFLWEKKSGRVVAWNRCS